MNKKGVAPIVILVAIMAIGAVTVFLPILALGQNDPYYVPPVTGHSCYNSTTGAPEPCSGPTSPQPNPPQGLDCTSGTHQEGNICVPDGQVTPTVQSPKCFDMNGDPAPCGIPDSQAIPKKAVAPDKVVVPSPNYLNKIGAGENSQGTVQVKQPDGSWKDVGYGTEIHSYDEIKTGDDGRLRIKLLDDTVITLGPNSDMIMDEFVYDPNQSIDNLTATLLKGVFRYVTGKLASNPCFGPHGCPSGGYGPYGKTIKLPVGDLGIRGTDFVLGYDPDTAMAVLNLNEGKVDVTPKSTNKKQEFDAPKTITFDASGIKNASPLSPETWTSLVNGIEPTHGGRILLWLVMIVGAGLIFRSILKRIRRKKMAGRDSAIGTKGQPESNKQNNPQSPQHNVQPESGSGANSAIKNVDPAKKKRGIISTIFYLLIVGVVLWLLLSAFGRGGGDGGNGGGEVRNCIASHAALGNECSDCDQTSKPTTMNGQSIGTCKSGPVISGYSDACYIYCQGKTYGNTHLLGE